MSKPILVQKYGGSSVANLEKLRAVAEKIASTKARGYRIVVVVSAMGDTTERLLKMARQISKTPPRRELDMLLSTGERISMSLLSMAVQELGLEAISFTGSQSGIITNDRHFDAKIIEVRPIRIQDELERDKIVIVAGYQGMSYKREITTLGRGGSDLTAVALAAALKAEACEIYSDFDGIFDADPKIVPEAQPFREISGEEMEVLARAGAKVLYSEAVAWARKNQIALYAKATNGQSNGTLIRTDLSPEQLPLPRPALSALYPLVWLQIPRPPTPQSENPSTPIEQIDLKPELQFSTEKTEHLIFKKEEKFLKELRLYLNKAELKKREVAAVSWIGGPFALDPKLLSEAKKSLFREKIPILASLGTPLRQTLLIPTDKVEQAQKILHKAFSKAVKVPNG